MLRYSITVSEIPISGVPRLFRGAWRRRLGGRAMPREQWCEAFLYLTQQENEV